MLERTASEMSFCLTTALTAWMSGAQPSCASVPGTMKPRALLKKNSGGGPEAAAAITLYTLWV